ncbi:heparin binding hemagglutinin HbhA [Streptoalloteichus tenebrarius]|uniref:Heparin binding hemagglutinin HbhA n=1 Tax=Streptoalloteichus tenebrarius (strain ATCC 17920 / DSM 40477 / JCM 4838 / CBS 697.72 / NBRC 16177 / NCIMB 11028 / NRRL B-12390 / A12253. 1 / ISP 5477) TaxID=1933 RepID=A0ABT1HVA2_STRSD|nr:hypothetical protein [Streptoalloteichus tenebrarius]MCP2259451.1 heparin binding hemagglutinin HbhA [Streptoalloteichus tenebrarius]BFF02393.1 hypothetical protein GCM10020241_40680 [Streptoalloteichus tenebrarius]
MPNGEDVRTAREQAAAAVSGVLEQARTPLLAVLGAGDVAARSVVSLFQKLREQVTERAEAARSGVDDLPHDLEGLRAKLDPAELRELVDAYAKAATQLYEYLAERGEQTLERLRPQVERLVEQAGTVAETAQQRAGEAAGEARELADDVLGKVTRRQRPAAAPAESGEHGAHSENGVRGENGRKGAAASAESEAKPEAGAEKATPAPGAKADGEDARTDTETGKVTRTTSRRSTGRKSGSAQENGGGEG